MALHPRRAEGHRGEGRDEPILVARVARLSSGGLVFEVAEDGVRTVVVWCVCVCGGGEGRSYGRVVDIGRQQETVGDGETLLLYVSQLEQETLLIGGTLGRKQIWKL